MTTADTEDAAFSGDVSLVLRGTSGATTYGIPLTSAGRCGKSPFAAGSKAEFRVRAADVWPLESATVSMVTGPNSGSSWRPLKLEVRAAGCMRKGGGGGRGEPEARGVAVGVCDCGYGHGSQQQQLVEAAQVGGEGRGMHEEGGRGELVGGTGKGLWQVRIWRRGGKEP